MSNQSKSIQLPEGHKWKEVPNSGAETLFQCACGATFIHDGIDDSTEFEDGDGTCDETSGHFLNHLKKTV